MASKGFLTLILFYLACRAFCITDEEQAMFTNNHKECVEHSGVDITVLENAYEGEVKDDVNLKKYIKCFFTKSGFQNDADAGEMRYDAIRSFIPHMTSTTKGDPEGTIIACESKKLAGDNPDETAFLNFKCYLGRA